MLKTENTTPTSISSYLLVAIAPQEQGATVIGDFSPTERDALNYWLSSCHATGKPEEVVQLPPPPGWQCRGIVASGVGPENGGYTPERLRQAVGIALQRYQQTEPITVAFPTWDQASLQAVAEGAILGGYRFNTYRSEPKKAPSQVSIYTQLPEATRMVRESETVMEAVTNIRDLVNTSPSELYPELFVEAIRTRIAGVAGLSLEVYDFTRLQEEGYGGIVGVGQGSDHPPMLARLHYQPAADCRGKVALVGKGITFDSGGYSLKPAGSIITMKSDMAGAATVGNAAIVAAKLKLPVAVTAWMCLAENLVSGHAQRPDDVIRMKSGLTVEVTNTDAEGRLVLADGLAAAEAENPDLILDVATLTGAQIIALGNRITGVMGSARDRVVAASDACGEQSWAMPLPDYLEGNLKSQVADIANAAVGKREGGMLLAGVFLQKFVKHTPWAHLDIAGPSFNSSKPWGYTPEGGTGASLRTLVQVIRAHNA